MWAKEEIIAKSLDFLKRNGSQLHFGHDISVSQIIRGEEEMIEGAHFQVDLADGMIPWDGFFKLSSSHLGIFYAEISNSV